MVRFVSEVLNSVCPKLSFVVVSDAVVGYESGVDKVEVPRWCGEDNVEGGGKVCCKRE